MNLDLVKLGKAASAMLLAAAMAGCGGSGPTLIVPPTTVDLHGSMDLDPGVLTIAAGTSMTVGNTELSCSMDEDCELTVSRAQVTGQLMATSTGGTVTVMVTPDPVPTSLPLPAGHELMAGTSTIAAGDSMMAGRTTVSCPSGGDACELIVAADEVTGALVAGYFGGMPMVTVAMPASLALPAGHELMAGTVTIMAGGSTEHGRTTVTCPSDGEACELILEQSPAGLVASYLGGMPTVMVDTPASLPLPAGHELMAGTVTIMAGGSTEHGRTTVTCPSDGEACELILEQSPAGLVASYLGGMPTVMVDTPASLPLPAGHELVAGMVIMMAGESAEHGRTTVTCPSDGEACEFIVEQSPTGVLMASYFGGMPTVMVDTPTSLTLPPGHQLMPGTTHIKAGGSSMVGRTTVTCPSGGEACELIVTRESSTGALMAEYYGGTPMVDVAPHGVRLPMEHSLVAGMFTVKAGETETMGGVDFMCPAGGMDCMITITADNNVVMASSAGGAATAMQVDPRGYQAFRELSDAIINPRELNDLQTNLYHMMGVGGGVTSSVTTHETFVPGSDPNVRGVSDIAVTVMADGDDPTRDDDNADLDVINGSGMAVLDIAEPVLANDASRWDSDISVMADWDAPEQPARGFLGLIEAGGANLVNPSLVDWDMADDRRRLAGRAQPANIWTHYFQWVDPNLPGGRTLELDLRSDFVAGHANFWMPGQTQLPRDFPSIIARGASGTFDEVRVDWDDVMGDFNGDGVMNSGVNEIPRGGAIDLSYVDWADMDDMNGMSGDMGVEGTYQGVRGRFVCIDGGAAGGTNRGDGGTGDSECDVDHQTPGRLGISKDDLLVFLPYVHGDDPNWLAAGVWLTIPDDLREGDYAIGAFVYGNDPVTRLNRLLIDDRLWDETATYRGQAFGRYAEDMGGADDGAKTLGRFTADAVLTATFSKGGTTGNNPWDRAEDRWRELYPSPVQLPHLGEEMELPVGMIQGDLTGFETDDNGNGVFEARANWDVNFEETPIEIDMAYSPPPTSNPNPPNNPNLSLGRWRIAPEAILRFDAPASGHAGTPDDIGGGHALTGYWNGLFYGDPNNMNNDNNPLVGDPNNMDDDDIQDPWMGKPGNAAGTFALTSEREDGGVGDDYSLTMEGAFVTHWQQP